MPSLSPASLLPKIGASVFSLSPKPLISEDMTMLAGIGANSVRIEVPWAEVEVSSNPAVYRIPDAVDGRIAAARAAGMTVILLLDYSHPYYTGGVFNPPITQPQINAWCSYALSVAGRYRGDDVILELYNEPNNPGFWVGAPNPSQYAALLNAAVSTIYAAYPLTKMVTAGVGPVASDNNAVTFMSQVYPLLSQSTRDRLWAHSLHPYNHLGSPETLLAAIDAYRNGVGYWGKIIITEWGYPSAWLGTNVETTRSIYAARMIGCAILAGVSLLTFYNLRDTGTDQNNIENTFGLYTNGLSAKPAASVVARVAAAIRNVAFFEGNQLSNGVYRIILYDADGPGVTKLLWGTNASNLTHSEPMKKVEYLQNVLGGSEPTRVFGGTVNVPIANTYPMMMLRGEQS